MQPQFAATIAANSDGYFPVAGESAFWLEVRPGIIVNRLLDVALKNCDVKPGALITERTYGTLEVHGEDQGQVREAGRRVLQAAGVEEDDGLAPNVLTDEIIRQIDDHQAMMLNRTRSGMLVLGGDTLYTLEINPAIWVLLAANEAEKASPIRLVGLGTTAPSDACAWPAPTRRSTPRSRAVHRTLEGIGGRKNTGVD